MRRRSVRGAERRGDDVCEMKNLERCGTKTNLAATAAAVVSVGWGRQESGRTKTPKGARPNVATARVASLATLLLYLASIDSYLPLVAGSMKF